MILPSYTDEMILNELKDDWPSVKRQASRFGQKMMEKMPKGQFNINPNRLHQRAGYHRSKNGNRWYVAVYCPEGSKTFWTVTYVEMERGSGLKSRFYLRGMNTPKQYYVEIVPHVIKRMRERFIDVNMEHSLTNRTTREILDHGVFERHECGCFLRSGTYNKRQFVPYVDSDGNTHGKLLTQAGLFGARITPMGNFILRTYITPDAPKGSFKEKYIMMFYKFYWSHNDPEMIKNRNKTTEMLVVSAYKLGLLKLIESYTDRFVPLYP